MITLNERQPVDSDLGPGLELKSARERKGMSLNEAADALHLRPSIVDAIENGNYDLLPGQIFLKGYVRSYARLVGMDEERAISALQNQLASRQVETADVEAEKRPIRFWIPVLLILIAAAGGAIYLFSDNGVVPFGTQSSEEKQSDISEQQEALFVQKDGEQTDDEQTNSNTMSGVSGSPYEEEQSDPVAAEHDVVYEPATEPTESISPPEEQAEEIHRPVVIVENGPRTGSELVLSEPEVGTSDQSTIVDESAEQSDTSADPEEQTETTVVETQVDVGKIEMTFSGDSWVTVHNGNDKRVIAALKRAGQTSVYEGPLPFKLVVGDVSVTQLTFNGSPVNWQDYRVRNNRAELELR